MISRILDIGAKLFMVGWAVRNVIGLITCGPILYKMIELGGTPMAIWVGFCSIAGVVLNIVVPTIAYRKLKAKLERKSA